MIYLDHNATTPLLPEVMEAMLKYFTGDWGNPSSSYRFGEPSKKAVAEARSKVAALINSDASEIIFTSCATESNNTAIHAAIKATGKRHIVTSAVEHSSVLSYCNALEKEGFKVTYLPVRQDGLLALADLETAITDDTAIVSLMWANNETGVLFPVTCIGEICKTRGVLFHCDAVQAVGKIPVDTQSAHVDYLTISGHKLGATKGIGALYVRAKSPFIPLMHGGGQEQSRRGGTENVPYIAGLGAAADFAMANMSNSYSKIKILRDELETQILSFVTNSKVNGHPSERLPNTTNIHMPGLDNTAVLAMLDQAGICASSGSACMNSAITPSHVITAMTSSRKHAEESIRFSIGSTNTADEIAQVAIKMRQISNLMA